jgi:LruC domain-containing protein
MKKHIISIFLAGMVTAVLLSGCFLQSPFQKIERFFEEDIDDIEVTGGPDEENSLPPDVTADVPRESSRSFKYETMLPVRLVVDADLYTEDFELLSTTAPGVLVRVEDGKGNPVFSGITNDYGVLDKEVRLPGAPEDMTLILHAEGYKSRTVVIGDMVEYAEINRTMGLVSKGVQSRDIHGLQDRDGDGIADVYDAYPDDIESAFAYKVPARGDLTVAYEDLFGRARAGDADYNDFIARYNIEESSSGEGITKIHVDVIAAEKLAGYNHTFGIRINRFEAPAKLTRNYVDEDGNEASFTQLIKEPLEGPRSLEIVLFEHTGRALSTGNVNADFTLEFVIDGVIDNPQDPEVLSRPPYNPYLYVHNTGHDVHLIDEEPLENSINKEDKFGNPETFRDADGFPWGLLVPPGPQDEDGWDPPLETQRIEVPYPRFTRWRQSGGELSPDWYLHSEPWEPEPAVYAAGYYEHPDTGFDVACYWDVEEGTRVDLTDGTQNARATDIFADENGIVYVSGYYESGGDKVACWWKNGVKQPDLESGGNPAEANSVFVYNGDVYIAGYYDSGASDVACWWKNGTKQPDLTGDNEDSNASSVFVHNGDVYISGNYDDGTYGYVATYWKNGTKITQDLFNEKSKALDLYVGSTGTVYLSGFYFNEAVPTLGSCYWIDGAGGHTPLYSAGISYGYSIFALSGDVYVAGFYQDGTDIACYWKNGMKQDLDNGRAQDVAHRDGTTFVCGYFYDGEKRIAVAWGISESSDKIKKVELYDSEEAGLNAEALSLAVQ